MATESSASAEMRRDLPDPYVVAYSPDREREYVIRLYPSGFIAVVGATKADGAEDLHIIGWFDEQPVDADDAERLRQEAIEVLDAYLIQEASESQPLA